MKLKIFFTSILTFLSLTGFAQSKEKAQTAFLKELNTILQNSKDYAWNDFMQEVSSVKIEKPFAIIDDVLIVKLTYKVADCTTRITMSAHVAKIKSIVYDHYLVLQFDEDEVVKEQFLPNDDVVSAATAQNYFHIGTPVKDGRKELGKLEKLLEKLLKYYKQ